MSKFNLWFKQNSPTILMITGIAGMASSVVLACVATNKVEKVVKPAKEKIVKDHNILNETIVKDVIDETKKDIRNTYIKTGLKVAGYYAPAVFVFGLSAAALCCSHNIMKGRNLALASTVTALKTSFDAYREKIKEVYGEDEESKIFKESGKTKKISDKKDSVSDDDEDAKVNNVEVDSDCPYACLWGPGNENYESKSNQLNITTLNQIETFMNQKLRAQGYLFLSDVYDALGYTPGMLGERRLQASRVLGWIYDPSDKTRDSYVDFGIHDKDGSLKDNVKAFACGKEDYVWLEFNVDNEDILTGSNGSKTFMKFAIKKSV